MPITEVRLAADVEVLQDYPRTIPAMASGIADVMGVARRDYDFDQTFLEQARSLTDIETTAVNPAGQVDADDFYRKLLGVADTDRPLFVLIGKDLRAEGTNFIFGFGLKEAGLCVQSLFRYARDTHRSELPTLVRHIARHEFGHLLGLDKSTIKNQDQRPGLYQGHCANDCTMQQVMTVPEAYERAQHLSSKPNAGFCGDCTDVLQGK